MIDFMLNFIKEAYIALIIVCIVLTAAMIYVFVITRKSFSKWKAREGKGAAASALLGVFSIIALAFIIYVTGAVFGAFKANASNYDDVLKSAEDDSLMSKHRSDMFLPGTFFNDTSVFMGIDHTFKVSPQCVEGGTDDRLTSNLGINQNVFRTHNKTHAIDLRYTHHSCVFGKDRNGYDALGLHYVWTIIQR